MKVGTASANTDYDVNPASYATHLHWPQIFEWIKFRHPLPPYLFLEVLRLYCILIFLYSQLTRLVWLWQSLGLFCVVQCDDMARWCLLGLDYGGYTTGYLISSAAENKWAIQCSCTWCYFGMAADILRYPVVAYGIQELLVLVLKNLDEHTKNNSNIDKTT